MIYRFYKITDFPSIDFACTSIQFLMRFNKLYSNLYYRFPQIRFNGARIDNTTLFTVMAGYHLCNNRRLRLRKYRRNIKEKERRRKRG